MEPRWSQESYLGQVAGLVGRRVGVLDLGVDGDRAGGADVVHVLRQEFKIQPIAGVLEEDLLAPLAAQTKLHSRHVVRHARRHDACQSRHKLTLGLPGPPANQVSCPRNYRNCHVLQQRNRARPSISALSP